MSEPMTPDRPHSPTLRAIADAIDDLGAYFEPIAAASTQVAENLRAMLVTPAPGAEGETKVMPHVAAWDRECAKRGHITVGTDDGKWRCVECKRVFHDAGATMEAKEPSPPAGGGGLDWLAALPDDVKPVAAAKGGLSAAARARAETIRDRMPPGYASPTPELLDALAGALDAKEAEIAQERRQREIDIHHVSEEAHASIDHWQKRALAALPKEP